LLPKTINKAYACLQPIVIKTFALAFGRIQSAPQDKSHWSMFTLLAMQGIISIREDPNIRFAYVPDNLSSVRAEAIDTAGHWFRSS
jgi:hypothetical protein